MLDVGGLIGHWGYLAILLIVVLGNVGLPVPEETALIAAGYLVWRYGLPPPIRRGGVSYLMLEQADEAMKEQAARYDRWPILG